MKIPENVKYAINNMFMCSNLREHLDCYQLFCEDLKDCTFIVFSENEGTKLPKALCTNYDNDFAVINIGYTNQYYAVNQQIYSEMKMTGKSDYYIDVCVDLDTQAVSYLKDIFVEYNQVIGSNKIKELIEYLQLPEVNYSCIPYLVENAGKKNIINKNECYKNIKSFMLFKAINMSKLLQEGVCEYSRREEDIWLDTDGLYNDMLSEIFEQAYHDSYAMQKALYVLLIKAICIEFSNSKKSAQNKMMELFDFVNEQLGFVALRELELCYYYFEHDDRTKKFFKKIQKNSKKLLKTIDGMAWDLMHIRLIEKEFMFKPTDEVRFAIHILLTFDNGLKEILEINPIEQIAFYKDIPITKLKNSWIDKINGAEEKLYSEENIQVRYQAFEVANVDKLRIKLEKELLDICKNN